MDYALSMDVAQPDLELDGVDFNDEKHDSASSVSASKPGGSAAKSAISTSVLTHDSEFVDNKNYFIKSIAYQVRVSVMSLQLSCVDQPAELQGAEHDITVIVDQLKLRVNNLEYDVEDAEKRNTEIKTIMLTKFKITDLSDSNMVKLQTDRNKQISGAARDLADNNEEIRKKTKAIAKKQELIKLLGAVLVKNADVMLPGCDTDAYNTLRKKQGNPQLFPDDEKFAMAHLGLYDRRTGKRTGTSAPAKEEAGSGASAHPGVKRPRDL